MFFFAFCFSHRRQASDRSKKLSLMARVVGADVNMFFLVVVLQYFMMDWIHFRHFERISIDHLSAKRKLILSLLISRMCS